MRVALRRALASSAVVLSAGLLASGALAADSGGVSGDGGTSTDEKVGSSASSGPYFPLRSKVDWGDGLGAGRGHQGQDLLTKCRKPVLAAQPGRVQARKRHSAAGNYVVIDGKGKRKDAVYMHLLRKASVHKGERVAAGEKIGLVGKTGRASACHLHFELWGGKGWYEGGSPVDPEPPLRKWKRLTLERQRSA